MLARHVLRRVRLLVEMPVAERVGCQQHGAPPGRLDGFAGRLAQRVHLVQAFLGRQVIGRVVGRNADDRDVPLRTDHVQCGDGAVIDPEFRVAHHHGGQAALARLLAARFRQFDIDLQLETVAEQVREDRIDRFAGEVPDAEEMVSDLGDPVRRVDQQHVRLQFVQALARTLVGPAQRLPAAFGFRLVLRRVLAIDQMGRMRCKEARDDFAVCHGFVPHSRFPATTARPARSAPGAIGPRRPGVPKPDENRIAGRANPSRPVARPSPHCCHDRALAQ